MKRVIEFMICLLLVFTVVYLKPPLTSHYQSKKKNDLEVEEVKMSHKPVPYYELNATGMADYIGKSEKEFLSTFPNPKQTYDSYFNEKWLVYGDSDADYFQVKITNNNVSSILVIGTDIDSDPFSMGMSLADIAEITTVFSNFNFEYENEEYEIELSEDDMNYSPLVAFNNGTFAILHFNQGTGQLIAVRYLDVKSLLILMPYQLIQENSVRDSLSNNNTDWKKVNEDNRRQMLELLNLFRKRDNKTAYKTSASLQLAAYDSFAIFEENPETIFKNHDRLADFELLTDLDNQKMLTTVFLESKEVNNLLNELKLDKNEIQGIFNCPVVDVSFMVTSWYSNKASYSDILKENDNLIGISFDKEKAMSLFEKKEKSSKTIESSE